MSTAGCVSGFEWDPRPCLSLPWNGQHNSHKIVFDVCVEPDCLQRSQMSGAFLVEESGPNVK